MKKSKALVVGVAVVFGCAFFGCSTSSKGPSDEDGIADGSQATDGTQSEQPSGTNTNSGDTDQQGGIDDATCGEVQLGTERQSVDMLIVLDRSDSMQGTLWRNMGESLTEITSIMSDRIDFGLILFPSLDCDSGEDMAHKCLQPKGQEVPYVAIGDPDAAEKIAAVFELSSQGGVGTCGNTPTANALDVARSYLDSLSTSDRSQTILLATDGAPNCNSELDGEQCICTWLDSKCTSGLVEYCLDHDRTVAASQKVNQAGYPVYVLGVGNSVDWEKTMNAIASAGGTQAYHPVTDPDHLLSAMSSITGAVTSCDFIVDWTSLPQNASTDKTKVNFYCKSSAAAIRTKANMIGFDEGCSAGTGWNWDGDNVVFCQDVCQRLKAGDCAFVEATFGCDSGPLVK